MSVSTIEQKLCRAASRIPSDGTHSQPALGENEMKFSPILLCSVAALLTSAPVWADRIDAGETHEVDNQKLAAIVPSHSALKLSHFQSDRFHASLAIGLEVHNFSGTLGSVPLSRPDSGIDSANFAHFDFQGGDSLSSLIREPWRSEPGGGNEGKGNAHVVATPEPGSSLLLLLGLCSLGFFAYRRSAPGKKIYPSRQLSTGL
jgi:PEP-CTERM motif